MNVQAEVPTTDPLRSTWEEYRLTDAYANTRNWALKEPHVDGSLWAAYAAGYKAALAAPKEAGDAEANIEYLQRVRKEDGAEAALDDAIDMLRRLAAPSKEAGRCDGNHAQVVPCADPNCWQGEDATRPPAAPQADQQGVAFTEQNTIINLARDVRNAIGLQESGELTPGACENLIHKIVSDYENAAIRRQHEAAKPSDQQGASLEGDALLEKWRVRYNELIRADRTYEAEQVLRCTNDYKAAHTSSPADCSLLAEINRRYEEMRAADYDPDARVLAIKDTLLSLRAYAERQACARLNATLASKAPRQPTSPDDLIVRLQHYVDHMGDMQDGLAGGDPQAVRDTLSELLRQRASKASPDDQRQEGACVRHACKRVRMEMQAEIERLRGLLRRCYTERMTDELDEAIGDAIKGDSHAG